MQEALEKNKELMLDFVNALIACGQEEAGDPRHGGRCAWHVHEKTQKCVQEGREPWARE